MNETIKTQLNHRTIRAFKNQELTDEQKKTLEEVARHTSTSIVFAAVLDDARYG